ncbi:hypothetical protein [Solirubrum puertoriconensis]|uniref:Uncharacterized protein n=1 Tax=Solirubrum puertoriconensis TaxID=1751427 RepID=A0A9X0HPH1_SOLP1|nr:hypothetical protein [Solirubrum puertoriconensis]KUG09706.1 hypothetical protein ASU33_18645 [Solirubrum puertoriconensis]
MLYTALQLLIATSLGQPTTVSPMQAEHRVLDANRLPATAAQVAAFVPKGWKLERQLSGDLNTDKRPDKVLMLIEQQSPDPQDDTRYRALMVLLTQPDGNLRRVGVGSKLLYCTSCFGALGGEGIQPELSIERGVLLVSHYAGSRWAYNVLQRFRFEPNSSRVRLIGEDYTSVDRANGSSKSLSTNMLTGQQVLQVQPAEGQPQPAPQRRTVRVPKLYLEDVDPESEQSMSWTPKGFLG